MNIGTQHLLEEKCNFWPLVVDKLSILVERRGSVVANKKDSMLFRNLLDYANSMKNKFSLLEEKLKAKIVSNSKKQSMSSEPSQQVRAHYVLAKKANLEKTKRSSWATGLVVEGKEKVGSKLMTGMTIGLANNFTQDIDDNNFSVCPKTI